MYFSVILGENKSESALAGGLIEKLSSLIVTNSDRLVKVLYNFKDFYYLFFRLNRFHF
jgi:hypothetical protein